MTSHASSQPLLCSAHAVSCCSSCSSNGAELPYPDDMTAVDGTTFHELECGCERSELQSPLSNPIFVHKSKSYTTAGIMAKQAMQAKQAAAGSSSWFSFGSSKAAPAAVPDAHARARSMSGAAQAGSAVAAAGKSADKKQDSESVWNSKSDMSGEPRQQSMSDNDKLKAKAKAASSRVPDNLSDNEHDERRGHRKQVTDPSIAKTAPATGDNSPVLPSQQLADRMRGQAHAGAVPAPAGAPAGEMFSPPYKSHTSWMMDNKLSESQQSQMIMKFDEKAALERLKEQQLKEQPRVAAAKQQMYISKSENSSPDLGNRTLSGSHSGNSSGPSSRRRTPTRFVFSPEHLSRSEHGISVWSRTKV